MKRVRARLFECTAPTLLLFCASIAAPRPGLYFHHHADGDRPHVHDDDDHVHGDEDHVHDFVETPHHHHHVAAAAEHGPELEAPDHDEDGHWHSQTRFHRTLAPALVAVEHAQPLAIVAIARAHRPVDRPSVATRARGPPVAS